jgi:hypothetical protein
MRRSSSACRACASERRHAGPPLTGVREPFTLVLVRASAWFRVACMAVAAVPLGATVPAQAGHHPASSSPLHLASPDYRVNGYRPKPVPPDALPGDENYIPRINDPTNDPNGVKRWQYGDRWVYHPLVIVRYGVNLLNGYRLRQNPAYLDRARVNADFLINTAVSRQGALYFPYRFNYRLFGNPADPMRAPWYSAMMQGEALTLFVRLHAATGEQRWREAADSTFLTFLQRPQTKRPWTTFVAAHGGRRYLWFEEYAKFPTTRVLNGHLYALFGIYEYLSAMGNPAAVTVFDGGATTVRHQVRRFRARGEISYYSLRVHAQYASYHCIHVWQLKLLTRMTGDSWFAREARRFASDARSASKGC